MKKKSIVILFVASFIIILLLIGYIFSTESSIVKKVQNEFGDVQLIRTYKNSDRQVWVFKDKQYGFTFNVRKYKTGFDMDGTTFFHYIDFDSTFKHEYVSYIKKRTKSKFEELTNNIDIEYEWNKYYSNNDKSGDLLLLYIKDSKNIENIKVVSSNFAEEIRKLDTRKFLTNGTIYCYEKNTNNLVGQYEIYKNKYLNKEEVDVQWALNSAFVIMQSQMNIHVKNVDELEFIKKEVMDVKDIPGLEIDNLVYRIDDTDESLKNTDVYYYKYNSETWIVANCIVNTTGKLYVHKLK